MAGHPTGQAEVDISREGAQRRQTTEGIWYASTPLHTACMQHTCVYACGPRHEILPVLHNLGDIFYFTALKLSLLVFQFLASSPQLCFSFMFKSTTYVPL